MPRKLHQIRNGWNRTLTDGRSPRSAATIPAPAVPAENTRSAAARKPPSIPQPAALALAAPGQREGLRRLGSGEVGLGEEVLHFGRRANAIA